MSQNMLVPEDWVYLLKRVLDKACLNVDMEKVNNENFLMSQS